VLADPHLTEIGLAVRRTDGSHRDVMAGSPISVAPLCATPPADFHDPGPKPAYMTGLGPGSWNASSGSLRHGPVASASGAAGGLLAGLRVVDFSAFVTGPLAAEILADLGADVIKVEPRWARPCAPPRMPSRRASGASAAWR
jgi:hypothetical protein